MVKRQSEKQLIKGQSWVFAARRYCQWAVRAHTHPCTSSVLLHLADDYDPDDRFAETPDPGQVSEVELKPPNCTTGSHH